MKISNSTKVFWGLILFVISLIIFAIMNDKKIIHEKTTPDKLYTEITCYRDQPTEVPISDGIVVRISYTGMIGNDTFVFHRSATHNSWSVYYKTNEKVIKHRGYNFEVIVVTPSYIILKPARE